MKSKFIFAFVLIPAFCLSGCGQKVTYKEHLDDYVKTMEYLDGFNILQLTDIHWSTGTDEIFERQYLNDLIAEVKKHAGKIDLIELTGDQLMLTNSETVTSFLSFMESLEIPYASVWGNHDTEGTYSPSWLIKHFKSAPHSLYTEVENDDVYGKSNFVINLMKDGACKWQIANLDSGASYTDSAAGFFRTYDYIRENQAEWWKAEHDKVGASVPTIAYYHIAQYETEEAWKMIEADPTCMKNKFYKLEDFASSKKNQSNFFNVAKENGLKGAFMGHAHSCDVTFDYQGVTMGLGVKTGKELYYAKISAEQAEKVGLHEAFDLMGASLVTLHDDQTFNLEHLYFNERGANDFAAWVTY